MMQTGHAADAPDMASALSPASGSGLRGCGGGRGSAATGASSWAEGLAGEGGARGASSSRGMNSGVLWAGSSAGGLQTWTTQTFKTRQPSTWPGLSQCTVHVTVLKHCHMQWPLHRHTIAIHPRATAQGRPTRQLASGQGYQAGQVVDH